MFSNLFINHALCESIYNKNRIKITENKTKVNCFHNSKGCIVARINKVYIKWKTCLMSNSR